jgi:amphi-Trp domain-containing protein
LAINKSPALGILILENKPMPKKDRDIDKAYSNAQTAAKLRRLADCLEQGKPFRIQVAGERVIVPGSAVFSIEHEREGKAEEIEFQFKWMNI